MNYLYMIPNVIYEDQFALIPSMSERTNRMRATIMEELYALGISGAMLQEWVMINTHNYYNLEQRVIDLQDELVSEGFILNEYPCALQHTSEEYTLRIVRPKVAIFAVDKPTLELALSGIQNVHSIAESDYSYSIYLEGCSDSYLLDIPNHRTVFVDVGYDDEFYPTKPASISGEKYEFFYETLFADEDDFISWSRRLMQHYFCFAHINDIKPHDKNDISQYVVATYHTTIGDYPSDYNTKPNLHLYTNSKTYNTVVGEPPTEVIGIAFGQKLEYAPNAEFFNFFFTDDFWEDFLLPKFETPLDQQIDYSKLSVVSSLRGYRFAQIECDFVNRNISELPSSDVLLRNIRKHINFKLQREEDNLIVQNKHREAYISNMLITSKDTESAKLVLANIENKIKFIEQKIASLKAMLSSDNVVLEVDSILQDYIANNLQVESGSVTPNGIQINTFPIMVDDLFEMGPYTISLNLMEKKISVKGYGNDYELHDGHIHPHCPNDGTPCLGNYNMLFEFATFADFPIALDMMLAFLGTHNPTDEWGSMIWQWGYGYSARLEKLIKHYRDLGYTRRIPHTSEISRIYSILYGEELYFACQDCGCEPCECEGETCEGCGEPIDYCECWFCPICDERAEDCWCDRCGYCDGYILEEGDRNRGYVDSCDCDRCEFCNDFTRNFADIHHLRTGCECCEECGDNYECCGCNEEEDEDDVVYIHENQMSIEL